MSIAIPNKPIQVIHEIILPEGFFPNNEHFPLLIYKSVFDVNQRASQGIEKLLAQNNWGNSWVDGVYDYHHYHSNTHEVLVIIAGECDVIYGGPNGRIFKVSEGDVVIHPAGVSHKRVKGSENFACIGAYPEASKYDMNYGKPEEHPEVDENIKNTDVPSTDPVFGNEGILFQYWQSIATELT